MLGNWHWRLSSHSPGEVLKTTRKRNEKEKKTELKASLSCGLDHQLSEFRSGGSTLEKYDMSKSLSLTVMERKGGRREKEGEFRRPKIVTRVDATNAAPGQPRPENRPGRKRGIREL